MNRDEQPGIERKDASDDRKTGRSPELASRILFLFAGGLLLSVLVSCACGPAR